jgi:hypothetical protein
LFAILFLPLQMLAASLTKVDDHAEQMNMDYHLLSFGNVCSLWSLYHSALDADSPFTELIRRRMSTITLPDLKQLTINQLSDPVETHPITGDPVSTV